MRKRIIEIDMARGLATIAVIAIHISAGPILDVHTRHGVAIGYLLINMAARFAVPTFVLLSALGLALSGREREGYLGFIKHRLGKIVPAYVLWTLIYTLIYDPKAAMLSIHHKVTVHMLAENLLTGNACYHLYFVPLIVMLYLLYPWVKGILATKPGLIAAFCISIGAICVSKYVDYPEWADYLLDYMSPLNWIFYFAAGIWLAKPEVMDTLRGLKWKSLISVSVLVYIAGMVLFIYRFGKIGPDVDTAIEMIGPFIVPFALLVVAWVWSRSWDNEAINKSLSWISRYSYGIYLSHALVLAAVYRLCYILDGHTYGPMYGVYSFVIVGAGTAALNIVSARAKRIIQQPIADRLKD